MFGEAGVIKPMRFKEWLKRYGGKQLNDMLEGDKYYKQNGLSNKLLTTNSMFLKIENKPANWWMRVFEEIKSRLIISCHPAIKRVVGPWCVAVSKYMAKLFNVDNQFGVTYAAGLSQQEIGDWFTECVSQFGNNSIYDNDMSGYDSTQSDLSLKTTNNIFSYWGVAGDAMRALRAQELKQKICSKTGIVVERKAFMKTGVPNTTITNSLTNIIIHLFAFMKIGAIPYKDFRMIIMGDDMLAFVSKKISDNYLTVENTIKQLGFRPKIRVGLSAHEAKFCSMSFLPTLEGTWMPGPLTGKCMFKLAFSPNLNNLKLTESIMKQHRRGVALGLLSITNHVPVLRDYIQNELKLTEGAKGKYLQLAKKMIEMKYFAGSSSQHHDYADVLTAQRYNVTTADLNLLTELIQRMNQIGWYQLHNSAEIVSQMLCVDMT